MDTKRFVIGDAVLVKATVDAHYDEKDQRVVERKALPEPKQGQVVGMTRIYLGKYKAGMTGLSPDDDYPSHLAVKGCETVWLVRFGMLNREVRVRDEDLELVAPVAHLASALANQDALEGLRRRVRKGYMDSFLADCDGDPSLIQVRGCYVPLFDQEQPPADARYRAMMRNEMKDWPRGKDGRWMKKEA